VQSSLKCGCTKILNRILIGGKNEPDNMVSLIELHSIKKSSLTLSNQQISIIHVSVNLIIAINLSREIRAEKRIN